MGMLHVILRDGLEDDDFIAQHTTGFEQVAESVRPLRSADGRRNDGRSAGSDREERRTWFAKADRAIAMHARGLEHQSKGVENCLALINLTLATGHIGREGCGCTMITGQGNGQGGREHGQKCDQLPGQRSLIDPAAREHVAKVWGISPGRNSAAGLLRAGDHERDSRGEIKALLSICFNPLVSLPRCEFHAAKRSSKLEFFGVIDFFLSETAHHADVVLAGSLQEEEEGVDLQRRRARDSHSESGRSAGQRARRFGDHLRSGATPGQGEILPVSLDRARFSTNCARHRAAATPTTTASPTKRSIRMGVFWPCPTLDHPGTPRLFADGRSFHPDGKCRFMSPSGAKAAIPSSRLSHLSDDGTRREPVSFRHADTAHRRAGRHVSRSREWRFIRAWPSSTESRTTIG